MKIISKHKDYYDYYKGILGEDPILIYDRRKEHIVTFTPNETHHRYRWMAAGVHIHKFHICNEVYVLYEYEGKLYYASSKEEMAELNRIKPNSGAYYINRALPFAKIYTQKNKQLREPVLYSQRYYNSNDVDENTIPILDTFSFARIVPALEMWTKISNFLGWLKDHPPIESNLTDLEKLDSYGFDRKKSFRHRK